MVAVSFLFSVKNYTIIKRLVIFKTSGFFLSLTLSLVYQMAWKDNTGDLHLAIPRLVKVC